MDSKNVLRAYGHYRFHAVSSCTLSMAIKSEGNCETASGQSQWTIVEKRRKEVVVRG